MNRQRPESCKGSFLFNLNTGTKEKGYGKDKTYYKEENSQGLQQMPKGWDFTITESTMEKICNQTSRKRRSCTFRTKVDQNQKVPLLQAWN